MITVRCFICFLLLLLLLLFFVVVLFFCFLFFSQRLLQWRNGEKTLKERAKTGKIEKSGDAQGTSLLTSLTKRRKRPLWRREILIYEIFLRGGLAFLRGKVRCISSPNLVPRVHDPFGLRQGSRRVVSADQSDLGLWERD